MKPTKSNDKPERARDITAGLLRQRRNLIGTALLLFFYVGGNITLSKINILGNTFTIDNPNFINYFIWVFYIYFFYRYWLYLKEEPKSEYERWYRDALDKEFSSKVKAIALKQNNQNHELSVLKGILEERNFFLQKSGNYKSLNFFFAETNAIRYNSNNEKYGDKHVSAKYLKFRFWYLHIIVSFKMAFRSSVFSDYYLPIYISILCGLFSGAMMLWRVVV